jgi:hypothetical protein
LLTFDGGFGAPGSGFGSAALLLPSLGVPEGVLGLFGSAGVGLEVPSVFAPSEDGPSVDLPVSGGLIFSVSFLTVPPRASPKLVAREVVEKAKAHIRQAAARVSASGAQTLRIL